MGVWPLREQLDQMYQTDLALYRRNRKALLGLHRGPGPAAARLDSRANSTNKFPLYTAAKFAAAREDRRTTHPSLRDARGLLVVSGDVTGLLTVTGELTGSRGPTFAGPEPRAPAIPAAMDANRSGASFHEESARPLCRRTRKVPVITEQIVAGIYLRYLPEDLGAQVRQMAPDTDLETLYAAAKFAAARGDRGKAHPLLQDALGLTRANGDVTGLLPITGELSGNRDPVLADREPRAPSLSMPMEVNRPGAPFHEEGAQPPVPGRRRKGFPDRHARPLISSSHAPPRPYVPRTRYGFEDVAGRDQGHSVPRGRAADRRYSADPRPARWPQVHMTNVHRPQPELARWAGPSFHPMAPRRTSEFPSATASVGWNPCFACGQTGHRLMNCATQ